jgi:hypothetical protein
VPGLRCRAGPAVVAKSVSAHRKTGPGDDGRVTKCAG